ncbi:MAG: hypothetical protein R2710_24615 [Acidimicrobiales bacterium]
MNALANRAFARPRSTRSMPTRASWPACSATWARSSSNSVLPTTSAACSGKLSRRPGRRVPARLAVARHRREVLGFTFDQLTSALFHQ